MFLYIRRIIYLAIRSTNCINVLSCIKGHLLIARLKIVPLYKDMFLQDEHVVEKKSVRTKKIPLFLMIFVHEIILLELKRALIDDLSYLDSSFFYIEDHFFVIPKINTYVFDEK